MFAVIKTGGKQYKVAENTILEIEKLEGEAGDMIQFDEVLMVGGDNPVIGAPIVTGAAVTAEVIEQKRGPKTIKFVKRRRKHSSQRRRGHRQSLTVVKIAAIIASGAKAAPAKAAKADDEKKAAPKKAAAKKTSAKAEEAK